MRVYAVFVGWCVAALVAGTAAFASPTPQPPATATAAPGPSLPPISVELCVAEAQNQDNPNLQVGISFRDLSEVTATEVRFVILIVDSQGRQVTRQLVSIDGHFGPNVLIAPRRSPLTELLLMQPEYTDSPAWNVPNHYGSGANQVRCLVDSARFADGTVWPPIPLPGQT